MDTTLSSVQLASMFVGVVLPLLVGLFTHDNMHPAVRPVALAFLSAVSGFLTEYIGVANRGEDFEWVAALTTWLFTFIAAVAVHYGFWKPTGVTEVARKNVVTSKHAA